MRRYSYRQRVSNQNKCTSIFFLSYVFVLKDALLGVLDADGGLLQCARRKVAHKLHKLLVHVARRRLATSTQELINRNQTNKRKKSASRNYLLNQRPKVTVATKNIEKQQTKFNKARFAPNLRQLRTLGDFNDRVEDVTAETSGRLRTTTKN